MAKPILIIDPGHGGIDPGGGTNRYWKEKDLILKISLYQYNRYKELGVPVAMTRSIDKTLDPDERTRIVRNSGAKYCHSNHINAGGGDGAEVIHSIYDGKEMAERIAQELKREGQNIRRVFTRTLPGNASKDYYFIIRETATVITNIIEYGFADSPGDDIEQLRNNHLAYAEAVVRAFCQHVGIAYRRPKGEIDDVTIPIISPPTENNNLAGPGTTGESSEEIGNYIHLPASENSWRVYPLNAAPVKGNEKGYLNPAKFSGLTYKILDIPQEHVYTIETNDFGKVKIYGHPSTGASITPTNGRTGRYLHRGNNTNTSTHKYLHLPSSINSWRVYPLEVSPVKGNEVGFLNPGKFGGLTYEILGSTQAHVYIIETRDFGRVQIYAHPNTGATISNR
ncbi:N-acetylmuramoyl-L-alanine amidase [Ornithinibacillus sp. JPR2-1]|uniref:N-acetylmuramoyl-L-alanine amidase family protein n=1 Tax=Ornithinibacillus sp. JPR2-1 TaxID=2094019 RepID=UPI0031D78902